MSVEKQITELMVYIRRNSQPSGCLDQFECLLRELREDNALPFVTDMHSFITYYSGLLKQIDLLTDRDLQAQILTKEHMKPERFFKASERRANRVMRLRRAVEVWEGLPESPITVDTQRRPAFPEMTSHDAGNLLRLAHVPTAHHTPTETTKAIREEGRKIMLLWNTVPAVIKALLQTKRRSLGMDNNSKRFK